MKKYEEYRIEHKKLGLGKHRLHYDIDKDFFKEYDYSEFEKFNLSVDLDLEINRTFVLAQMYIKGTVNIICDRCGEFYDQKINHNVFLMFRISDENIEEENYDEVVYVKDTDESIDIKKILYDYIILSIPMHHTHPDDQYGNPGCKINYEGIVENRSFKDLADWNKIKNILNK